MKYRSVILTMKTVSYPVDLDLEATALNLKKGEMLVNQVKGNIFTRSEHQRTAARLARLGADRRADRRVLFRRESEYRHTEPGNHGV